MRMNRKVVIPIYKTGDLLVKQRQDDYWFDHLVILGVDSCINEYVYELFTSDGDVQRRTVEWVQLNYRRSDDVVDSEKNTEMDQSTV